MASSPASPCNGICELHDDGKHCLGCGRTTDDLLKWTRLSPEERQERTEKAAWWLENEMADY